MNAILNKAQKQQASKVKLLVLDVDGVLSNGHLIFDNNGIETKTFNVKDGLGIKLLLDSGVDVAIITGRNSHIVSNRAKSLGIKHVIQGREDKGVALEFLCAELSISVADCAYMGDDLPDISALNKVSFATAPANAHPEVLSRVDFISSKNGGKGAVRELCDAILQAQGTYDDAVSGFIQNNDVESE